MYLTDKKNNITRKVEDHEDVEVLLESFSKQVEEIVNEAENIEVRPPPLSRTCNIFPHHQSNVQSTQEIVELILDSNRNTLLALDLKVGRCTLCFICVTHWTATRYRSALWVLV